MSNFKNVSFGILIAINSFTVLAQNKLAVDYVNPLIGTPVEGFEGKDGGGTMPCVGTPFAMTNFVPQTRDNKISKMPYAYEDNTIRGFMATHQPTVWMGDYGYVSVMPQIGKLKLMPDERALSYTHDDEISKPYHYQVTMDAFGKKIKGEIAAASRCGMFQFTFPKSEESHLIIQGINVSENKVPFQGYVQVNEVKGEITGYNPERMSAHLGAELKNFKGYFVIQFDKEFNDFGTWNSFRNEPEIHIKGTEQTGQRMGAYISFSTKKNEIIKVRVATSFISIEQARINLEKEIPHWNFNQVVNDTKNTWEENLSRIKVDGASETQKEIFYTALFHTMLFPREFSEYGKYYSPFDDKIHEGVSYNDYSLWDTFRALQPLLHFTHPERVSPMINSLLQMYKEGGWLPKWPNPTYSNIMIGTHADAVISDAYIKGFRDYDVNLAYEAVRKDAMHPPLRDTERRWGDRDEGTLYEARGGLTYYHSLGYVPADKTRESVSRTIEFGIDDFAIAQMAKHLEKKEDYNSLMSWSKNYKNLYNESNGFLNAKVFNGDWHQNAQEGFTEGGNIEAKGALYEMKALRAYLNMLMLDSWGIVFQKEMSSELSVILRGQEAIDYIESELLSVADVINTTKGPGRMTQAAVWGFLARLHLNAAVYRDPYGTPNFTTGDMDNVIKYTDNIINSNKFSLSPEYFDLFSDDNHNNAELIFAADQRGVLKREHSRWTYWSLPGSNWGRPEFTSSDGTDGPGMTPSFYQTWVDANPGVDPADADARFSWDTQQIPAELQDLTGLTPLNDEDHYYCTSADDYEFPRGIIRGVPWGPRKDPNGAFYTCAEGFRIYPVKQIKRNGPDKNVAYVDLTPQIDFTNEGRAHHAGYRFSKYGFSRTSPNANNFSSIDLVFLRYAEIYMMRAEAKLRNGDIGGALTDVNTVRTSRTARAPIPAALNSIDIDDLYREYGFEFYWEGLRRNNQIRFGHYEDSWTEKTDSDANNRLFPIPQSAVDGASNTEGYLDQNAGY